MFTKFQIFILITFTLVTFNQVSAMSDKPEAKKCADNTDIYFQIADKIIKHPRQKSYWASMNGEMVQDYCESNSENPYIVDELSFGLPFEIGDYPNEDFPNFGFKIILTDLTQKRQQGRWLFEDVKNSLKQQNKEIFDLPSIYNFYKYSPPMTNPHINQNADGNSAFIAMNDNLKDITGTPLILSLCHDIDKAAWCTASFKLSKNIGVSMSSQHDVPLPLNVWEDIYPSAIQKIKTLENHKTGDKK